MITEEQLYERYCERAGILQYDAGFSAHRASQDTFNAVARYCKEQRIPFPQSVREDFRQIIVGTHPTIPKEDRTP